MTPSSSLLGKDLLGLEQLTAAQITVILDTAGPLKEISERAIKKVPTLRGATVVNLFFEASTRTRISFEFAEKRMSADTVNVAVQGSSIMKGETLVDTARNLEAMRIDMVVIRHNSSGAARFLAERIIPNRSCANVEADHSVGPCRVNLFPPEQIDVRWNAQDGLGDPGHAYFSLFTKQRENLFWPCCGNDSHLF